MTTEIQALAAAATLNSWGYDPFNLPASITTHEEAAAYRREVEFRLGVLRAQASR